MAETKKTGWAKYCEEQNISITGKRIFIDGLGGKDLRSAWDTLREKLGETSACVIASQTPDGKVALLAAGTDAAVAAGFNAGNVVKEIAGKVGGRGGGRPNMAQAGGKDAAGIDDALAAARELLGA